MIILEGTDAVGKTTVKNRLNLDYLIDRDKEISKLFDFNISLIERVNKLKKYLDKTKNHIIFLINNDKEELEKRIYSRDIIDEFDKYAYLYNLFYLTTYLYMEQNNILNNQLFMVDCTNLSITEETNKVKELINLIMKGR